MATVGQALTAPEAGWKRCDAAFGGGFEFLPENTWGISPHSSYYNGSAMGTGLAVGDVRTNIGAYCLVRFKGTKFRLISTCNAGFSTDCKITIDDTQYTFATAHSNNYYQILVFEITELQNTNHVIKIEQGTNGSWQRLYVDAIDIDSDGYLIVPGSTNLTANAGDSQVTLIWDAVADSTGYNVKRSTTAGGPYTTIASNVSGTSYVDKSVVNGTAYYYVVTAITADGESANSNEASATLQEAPVEDGQAILRVTMIDSSEREYKVSKTITNDFVNWCNRTIGTGNSCYIFDKGIQNSKEYLFYEKIISIEVIPIAQ